MFFWIWMFFTILWVVGGGLAAYIVYRLLTKMACAAPPLAPTIEEEDFFPNLPGYQQASDGSYLEYDLGVFKPAAAKYEEACALGHPLALVNYALWYLEGRHGYKKDLAKAFEMFQKASEHEVGMALYNVADFYLSGKGGVVPVDREKAAALLKRAVKDPRLVTMKNAKPFAVLGQMYMSGDGVHKDYNKAQEMLGRAKELGAPFPNQIMRLFGLLTQLDPWSNQKETDKRWDRLCHYLDKNPTEKSKLKTVGNWMDMFKKFGYGVRYSGDRQRKCDRIDKFFEITGGNMQMLDTYDMQDAPTVKLCGECGSTNAKKKCQRCGQQYCSQKCQRADWPSHKQHCQLVQEMTGLSTT